MNSLFTTYLGLGFEHISDLNGYDHILFITALCAIYRLKEWRKVAILVTAFTIGHSVTLALAALDLIRVPVKLVEFLIPVTILITALYNIFFFQQDEGNPAQNAPKHSININYLFALLFGLIHGMGFSNFFRLTLLPGEEDKLIQQLLAFNIGVELGQLTIVAIILGISFLVIEVLKVKQRTWNLLISIIAAGMSIYMALERLPDLFPGN